MLTVTGVLHDPFGGRTLAWIVPVMGGRPSHTATARPSGASATAGLIPPPKVVAADQDWPFALVRTCTNWVPSAAWSYHAAACAPLAFTATDAPPTTSVGGMGVESWIGADQDPAAQAGAAAAVKPTTAITATDRP